MTWGLLLIVRDLVDVGQVTRVGSADDEQSIGIRVVGNVGETFVARVGGQDLAAHSQIAIHDMQGRSEDVTYEDITQLVSDHLIWISYLIRALSTVQLVRLDYLAVFIHFFERIRIIVSVSLSQ